MAYDSGSSDIQAHVFQGYVINLRTNSLKVGSEALNPFFLAKYPFVRGAREFVAEHFDLGAVELTEPEHAAAIERGFQRVCQAIRLKRVRFEAENMIHYDREVVSFPIAVMLVALVNDDLLRNIYATAEAKRCNELMLQNRSEILDVARELDFPFTVVSEEGAGGLLAIRLANYLSHSPHLWGEKWRLVNRTLVGGMVHVTSHEFARILEERIKRTILDRTRVSMEGMKLSALLNQKRDELMRIWGDYRAKIQPEAKVEHRAMPPCMTKLTERMTAGQNLSHVERRTMVSYLATIGRPKEEIMSLLRHSPDFKERIARYQLEHLTGRGGRAKKYLPPSCATMKTYGLCFPDEWCEGIRHPLQYRRGA